MIYCTKDDNFKKKIINPMYLSMLLSGLQSGIFDYLSSTMVSKMRKDLFDSIIKQEIAFFEKYKSGEILKQFFPEPFSVIHFFLSGVIISRITWDVTAVASRITSMFTGSPRSLLTMVCR